MPKGTSLQEIGTHQYETVIRSDDEIPKIVRNIVEGGGDIYSVTAQRALAGGYLFCSYDKRGGDIMRDSMMALIKKDFRGVTTNKHLFTGLLVVPLVLTIILPSVFVFLIYFNPNDPDIQKLLELLPQSAQYGSLELTVAGMILNFILPDFHF